MRGPAAPCGVLAVERTPTASFLLRDRNFDNKFCVFLFYFGVELFGIFMDCMQRNEFTGSSPISQPFHVRVAL